MSDRPSPPEETPASPAREYRRQRERRDAPVRTAVVLAILLLVGSFSAFYAAHAGAPDIGPPVTTAGSPPPSSYITLGTPSVRNTTCGNGATFETEWVPWVSAYTPLTTEDVYFAVEELIDGDIDGGPAPPPSVTGYSFCGGAPPTADPSWYVVLRSPVGINTAYFDYGQGWVPVGSSASGVPIPDNSTLVLLAVPFLAGTSFALCVFGSLVGPPINSCAQL